MKNQMEVVTINLLNRIFKINCPKEKVSELQQAAEYLNAKMRESIDDGKQTNLDLLLMIAALNITNEFMNLKRQENLNLEKMNNRIGEIQKKIELALAQ